MNIEPLETGLSNLAYGVGLIRIYTVHGAFLYIKKAAVRMAARAWSWGRTEVLVV